MAQEGSTRQIYAIHMPYTYIIFSLQVCNSEKFIQKGNQNDLMHDARKSVRP